MTKKSMMGRRFARFFWNVRSPVKVSVGSVKTQSVWGLGFRVQDLWFRVEGLGFGV